MERIFISGANRGIGLEFVRQYLSRETTLVFAGCRDLKKADALRQLQTLSPQRLVIIPLDVTDAVSIAQASQTIREHTDSLDLLINNAGIQLGDHQQTFENITVETMLDVFRVNSVAPLMLIKSLFDLLHKGSKLRLVNITSEMASLETRDYGGQYAYCTSKAALNMITRALAVDLKSKGIISICLDPGWVQTDMGGQDAELTPQESVRGMMRVIDGLNERDNGSFLRWNGDLHRW